MAWLSCHMCGETVNTEYSNAAQEVIGWVSPRKDGGANHIKHKKPTARWAHNACLEEVENPVSARQGGLF